MSNSKIRAMLAIALGAEERCREDIDKMYDTNEKMYYKVYESSGMSKTNIFDKFTVTTSEYIKKCYSILIVEEAKGNELFVMKLIKKGYKPAHTFFTHKTDLLLEEFTDWYQKKMGGLENVSGLYLDRCYYIMLNLAKYSGKKLIRSPLATTIINDFEFVLGKAGLSDIQYLHSSGRLDATGYNDLLDVLTYKGKLGGDVLMLIENLRLKEELIIMHNNNIDFTDVEETLSKMPQGRITNVLMVMLELFDISVELLRETKISNRTLKDIAQYLSVISNKSNIPKREREILFLSLLTIHALATEYNNLRSVHYANAKTKLIEKDLEYERLQKESELHLTKEIANLNELVKKSSYKITTLTSESESKDTKIKELELSNKRLNLELEKVRSNEDELQFLREFHYSVMKEREVTNKPIDNFGHILDSLSEVNGVIVAGHPNLQNKLKRYLPEFVFIKETETSRDISFVRNKDIVCYNSNHNNHGIFGKVIKELKNTDVPLLYLSKSQNIEILVNEIYQYCLENGVILKKEIADI